ncbi:hypothetical protein IJJ97_05110 [bacterium]|nr:hypothetical protein [bacterium]
MSDNTEDKDKGMSKFKGSLKASKATCPFVRPARIMKEGKITDVKLCTAYIPGFEVKDDRYICEQCNVPDMGVKETRCRFFLPMSIEEDAPTKWYCRLLGTKDIQEEQCNAERCPHFEKIERLKWEIGKIGVNKVSKQVEEVTEKPKEKRKLIPKGSMLKRQNQKNQKSSGYGSYGDSDDSGDDYGGYFF